ncbi:hypothetical protein LIER_34897 [Lithospermum erythrorhizon]|uniref:Uncharacterized protein n=1 Tax=Lithospermum erythrorhizon TaxID=34254 RepID=A0AAV3S3Q2_LITER
MKKTATPYALVYGTESVLPLKVQIPSLTMAVNKGLAREDNMRLTLQELDSLDEQRLTVQQRLECYQSQMSKAYDKKVKVRSYKAGDMVSAVIRPISTRTKNSKLMPKWDGPYVIQEDYLSERKEDRTSKRSLSTPKRTKDPRSLYEESKQTPTPEEGKELEYMII